jgi:hypothetical protein
MTETRATAHLPTLDMEFVRRELPDDGAEQIAVRMTAKPSFEAFCAPLRQALPAMMAMNPALLWLDVLAPGYGTLAPHPRRSPRPGPCLGARRDLAPPASRPVAEPSPLK